MMTLSRPFVPALALLLLANLVSGPAAGSILEVGTGEPGSYNTIAEALAVALAGDTILVGAGTFSGSGNSNLDLDKPLIIQGQGAESTVIDLRGPEICADQVLRRAFVIRGASVTRATVLKDLKILGGVAYLGTLPGHPGTTGGGVLIRDQAQPMFQRVVFEDCRARIRGAAVGVWEGASPRFENCTFLGSRLCEATDDTDGGAVAGDGFVSSIGGEFVDCLFRDNRAEYGGALTWKLGTLTIQNTRFTQNVAVNYAGGIALFSGGQLDLASSLLDHNTAGTEGAALFADGASGGVVADHVTLADNSGQSVVYLGAGGALQMVDSIVWGNGGSPQLGGPGGYEVATSDIELPAGVYPGLGNINADPQFCDPDGGTYTIRPDSPCATLAGDGGPAGSKPANCGLWTIEVDGSGDFATLREALHDPRVIEGDIIEFGPGTFGPSIVRNDSLVTRNLTLRGRGKGITILDLDCPTGCNQGSEQRALWIMGTSITSETVIEDLTIRRGCAEGSTSNYGTQIGGAVSITNGAAPVFRNVSFEENRARLRGGAVGIRFGGSALFEDCDFLDNLVCGGISPGGQTENEGGAVSGDGAGTPIAATFRRCLFEGNAASWGGAVSFKEGVLTIEDNSTLRGNDALTRGGAIVLFALAEMHLRDSDLLGNTALTSGPALYVNENGSVGSCTIDHVTVSQNAGPFVLFNHPNNGSFAVTNAILYGNGDARLTGLWGFDHCDVEGSGLPSPNLDADPLFCADGNPDAPFGLCSNSPCVGAASDGGDIGSHPVSCGACGTVTLQSVEVQPTSARVATETTFDFDAVAHYSDGSQVQDPVGVAWGPTAGPVATVDQNGTATSLRVGQITVTATLETVQGQATLVVDSLAIAPASLRVNAGGGSADFSATVLWGDADPQVDPAGVVWSSQNPQIATINASSGELSGGRVGQVEIGAVFGSGDYLSATAEVKVDSLAIEPASVRIGSGGTTDLSATVLWADAIPQIDPAGLAWSSSNEDVATVDPLTGLVTAHELGQALITVTLQDYLVATASVVVDSLEVSPATTSIPFGETRDFSAIVHRGDGPSQTDPTGVGWQSSDELIVTVNPTTGLAHGEGLGQAVITASFEGMDASATVTVDNVVVRLDVFPDEIDDLPQGGTRSLGTLATYANNFTALLDAASVNWTSLDPGVVSVDAGGVVTGESQGGPAGVKGCYQSVCDTTWVTVVAGALESITVLPASSTLVKTRSLQLHAIGDYSDDHSEDLTSNVTWASSNPTGLSITTSGEATGRGPGTFTVTATHGGGALQGQATVTVVEGESGQLTVLSPGRNDATDRWVLVTVPFYESPSGGPLSLVSIFGSYNTRVWRLGTWSPLELGTGGGAYLEGGIDFSALELGRGYWLATVDPKNYDISGMKWPEGDSEPPPACRIEIRGEAGDWSMIGHPYDFAVSVNSLLVTDGVTTSVLGVQDWIDGDVLGWDGSDYRVAQALLEPQKGYWVQKLRSDRVWIVVQHLPAKQSPLATFHSDKPEGMDWGVQLTAAREDGPRSTALLGAGNVPADRWSQLQRPLPPTPPGDWVRVAGHRDDWGSLSGDYRQLLQPQNDHMEWPLRIRSSHALEEITLSFESVDLPAEYQLFLSDPRLDALWEITPERTIALSADEEGRAITLIADRTGSLREHHPATAIGFQTAYPNPFVEETGFRFVLAAPVSIRVDVYDVAGRHVRTLERAAAGAGEHLLPWDGRDRGGRSVASGVYLVRYRAGTQSGTYRVLRIK